MDDSVATDAKRLLLRYGAPISKVNELSDEERITCARSVLKAAPTDRQAHLRQLLGHELRKKN